MWNCLCIFHSEEGCAGQSNLKSWSAGCVSLGSIDLTLRERRVQLPWQVKALRRDSQITSCQRRYAMKQSTKDAAKGRFHEVKGTVKETVGRATNNPDLEAEGQVEKIGGKIQKKIGQVKKVLGK
jgi:uncharacterized protein YjbJ (UPF0337 family)